MVQQLIGRDRVERIAVLVSGVGSQSKFLGAPMVESSSGENIALAVYMLLLDWGLLQYVKAMGFDTTASNTGDQNGACVKLQELMNENVLHLACRRHIHEILLRFIFDLKISRSTAPDVPLFDRFASIWKDVCQASFQTGFENEHIRSKITEEERSDLILFWRSKLNDTHPRMDYK